MKPTNMSSQYELCTYVVRVKEGEGEQSGCCSQPTRSNAQPQLHSIPSLALLPPPSSRGTERVRPRKLLLAHAPHLAKRIRPHAPSHPRGLHR